jgi:hypothetical protein
MMKRWILATVLAAAVAPAAFAASPGPSTNASNDCTALRAKMGATAFAQAYSSFGACVSRFSSLEQQNQASAQTSCTALQADPNFAATHNGETFAQFFGTGKNGTNAMSRCVAAIAKASSQTEQHGRLNPSQTCRAAKTKMGATVFTSTYGKNANDKNAFGKCVSKTAALQSQNELNAAAACHAAQTTNAATFASQYGTSSDAFGKCVSTTAAEKSTAQLQATVSAAKACLADEKTLGESAFMTKYGTFGGCVSLKAAGK